MTQEEANAEMQELYEKIIAEKLQEYYKAHPKGL